MQTVLLKLKFRENHSFIIPLNVTDFTQRLSEIIDPEDSQPFSLFGPGSENNFKGTVGINGFKLKSTILSKNKKVISIPVKGIFTKEGNKTKITVEIKADDLFSIVYFSFAAVMFFAVVFFSLLGLFGLTDEHYTLVQPLVMVILIILLASLYYFHLRRNIQIVKDELASALQALTN
ncbi:hypothetical protein [Flavobacterium humi]|uniref:Uncharacterized protein n=1 Tax=Flavobacterium humi TaxID=2562683 RepID=A0A4Z0L8Y3_9FLAO|nr:hypothetical protein [Flavobacterium humi]TGD57624.1 hypothetical protein E4635_10575 [Flavobacterium humi]